MRGKKKNKKHQMQQMGSRYKNSNTIYTEHNSLQLCNPQQKAHN